MGWRYRLTTVSRTRSGSVRIDWMVVQMELGKFGIDGSVRKRFSLGLRTERDERESRQIDEADGRSHFGVISVEDGQQAAADQGSGGGDHPSDVEAEAGTGRADPGRKELRQVEGQPSVERPRDAVGQGRQEQEGESE